VGAVLTFAGTFQANSVTGSEAGSCGFILGACADTEEGERNFPLVMNKDLFGF